MANPGQRFRWWPPLLTAAKCAAAGVTAYSLVGKAAQAAALNSGLAAAAGAPGAGAGSFAASVLDIAAGVAACGAAAAVCELPVVKEIAGTAAQGAMNATLKAARELWDWTRPALPVLGVLAVVGGATALGMYCAGTLELCAVQAQLAHVGQWVLHLMDPTRAIEGRYLRAAVLFVQKWPFPGHPAAEPPADHPADNADPPAADNADQAADPPAADD